MRLDDRVAVAGQLRLADVADVAKAEFTMLVNNRPDGEALFGQPRSAKIDAAARQAAIDSRYLPIMLPALGIHEVRAFHSILDTTEGPVLAFCKSGFRCALLWALDQVAYNGRPVQAIMRVSAEAGHDLTAQSAVFDRCLRELEEVGAADQD